MIMKENILNINSIKTNKKLLKEISLNRFVSEIFIENIMIYDCDNSTNLIIYNNQKNLILTCYNEPY